MKWTNETTAAGGGGGGGGCSVLAAYMCVSFAFVCAVCVSRKGGMQHPKDTAH